MPLLSIIIPVFRVEQTLDRCVESIVGQTLADIEIILVDDGSPDNCPAMCERWKEKDPRIAVIHKANGGLSDARNAGIDMAGGEYITFVDSDDTVDTGTYRELMDIMQPEYDILEYPVFWHYGARQQKRLTFKPQVFRNAHDYWFQAKAYTHTYACNKIYRKKLFDGTRFPKGKLFEDCYLLPQLLLKAKCVATTNRGMYYYYHNSSGITAQADGRALEMLLEAHISNNLPKDDPVYYMHIANIQIDVARLTGKQPVLANLHVRDTGRLPLTSRIKAIFINIFGINRLCRIYQITNSMRTCRW